MRTASDDGILHLSLPVDQHWSRSLLPGIARFIRSETPLSLLNHGSAGLVPALENGSTVPAGFLGALYDPDHPVIAILQRRRIAAVNISSRCRPEGVASVLHDDYAIGRMAAEHLARFGERSFLYLGLGKDHLSQDRLAGFQNYIRENVSSQRVKVIIAQREHLDRELARVKLPAAAFCAVDGRSRAMAQRAERLGIKIPEQFAIVGVDNDLFECEMTRTPLSSIELRFEELGYRAAEQFWKIYRGAPIPDEPVRITPSHVEVRLSTDFRAIEDEVVRAAMRLIEQPTDEKLSVADVATAVGFSRRALEKRFRKSTGKTIFSEINRVRMERARGLVEDTNLSTEAIAERIGLADSRRFVRLFKERFGKTPFAYRRR